MSSAPPQATERCPCGVRDAAVSLTLRSDRDTIAIGSTSASLDKPIEVAIPASGNDRSVELKWTVTPKSSGESQAFLAQLVETAKVDGGITLPTVGSEGLAEAGRVLEASVDELTDLAERAVATGDVEAAKVAARRWRRSR